MFSIKVKGFANRRSPFVDRGAPDVSYSRQRATPRLLQHTVACQYSIELYKGLFTHRTIVCWLNTRQADQLCGIDGNMYDLINSTLYKRALLSCRH